ncbi:MAG TPA: hypothetical protein ENK11_06220 [Phycisphaerales bacterium]|nr:hypothetical protein [Phycisphaerales bacterium]
MSFFPFSAQQFGPFAGNNSGFGGFGGFSGFPWSGFGPFGGWWNNAWNTPWNSSFTGQFGQFGGFPQFAGGNWTNGFGGWNTPFFWNNWNPGFNVPFASPVNWGFFSANTSGNNNENNTQNVPFGFAGFTPFGFVNPVNGNSQTQAA